MVQSLSRPRQCWDNAVAESFFASLKLELIDRRSWATRTQVRRALFDYIERFFNRRRLHSPPSNTKPRTTTTTTTTPLTRHSQAVRRTGSRPSAPTSSTVPTASWPRLRPSGQGHVTFRKSRSVPQIVTASHSRGRMGVGLDRRCRHRLPTSRGPARDTRLLAWLLPRG
jgi:Integrase core domain